MRTVALTLAALCLSSLPRAAAADVTAPARGTPRVIVHADHLELREPVYFDTAKATIKPTSHALLDEAARALADNPQLALVEIGVHSDERGADEYNLRITDERAAAIKTYLIAHGVAGARLSSRGYGESRPLCTEHDAACWSRNRRVELVVVPSAPHR